MRSTSDAAVRAALRGGSATTVTSTNTGRTVPCGGTRGNRRCERCGGQLCPSAYLSEVSCLQCGDVPQEAYAASLEATGLWSGR